MGEGVVGGAGVDDDVDDRRGECSAGRVGVGGGEDRDEGVEASLSGGAFVAVFEVVAVFAFGERVEDRSELGGDEWIASVGADEQFAAGFGDGCPSAVDRVVEVVEGSVGVESGDQSGDGVGELSVGGVFGEVDEDVDDGGDDVGDPPVGGDSCDLVQLVGGDVAGGHRGGECGVDGEESAAAEFASGGRGGAVERGAEVAECGVVFGGPQVSSFDLGDQLGAFGGESPEFDLVRS
ncbi:MAG: hypothetical protein ACO23O_11520 [Ilumatobacteraceae bacterium]